MADGLQIPHKILRQQPTTDEPLWRNLIRKLDAREVCRENSDVTTEDDKIWTFEERRINNSNQYVDNSTALRTKQYYQMVQ